MAQLIEWKSAREAKEKLARRLRAAKDHRKRMLEDQWRFNERAAFGGYEDLDSIQQQIRAITSDTQDFDLGETIEVNYAFKDLRFLHAQMSSNPPVATPSPESSDMEDDRSAQAADQCMRWFLRQLQLQELTDLVTLDTLVYGTGIARTGFNANAGEILEFDRATGKLTMDGEIEALRVSPWNFYMDPSAQTQRDLRYVFEEITLTEEEVKSTFADKWQLFRAHKRSPDRLQVASIVSDRSILSVDVVEDRADKFVIYAYFEPGMPENGMLGRFCYCFEDGTLITAPAENPNQRHAPPSLEQRRKRRITGRKPKLKPATAYLPYHILTDIDIPGSVWGRSFLQYAGPAQNLMRSLDSAMLEAIKCHGLFRLVLPPGAKLAEDAISNTNVDVIQLEDSGSGEAHFIAPPGLPPAFSELRANMKAGVDDMAGVNESMFGQSNRETSGFQMQYAVNQGSMIRRRLFNKYVLFIESLYKALLNLAIQNWDDSKMIKVLGEEGAFDIVELRGIDLDGGYEITTEYGTSLSLDPQSRRDELLKLMPVFKDAGLDPKILVRNMKLAELRGTEDTIEMSRRRAKETIDIIIADKVAAPAPRYGQDTTGMLVYCKEYVMTAGYYGLPDEYKDLVEAWMRALAAAAAAEGGPAGGPQVPAPGGPGAGGELPPGAPGAPPGGPTPAPSTQAPGAPPLGAGPAGMPAAPQTPPVVSAA